MGLACASCVARSRIRCGTSRESGMVPPYGYNSRKNIFLPPYSHAVLTSMGCTPVFATLTKNTGGRVSSPTRASCAHTGIPATPVPSIVYFTTSVRPRVGGIRLPFNCPTPASSAIIDGLTNAAVSASVAQRGYPRSHDAV